LTARTTGASDGGEIDLGLAGALMLSACVIDTSTSAAGHGGNITIRAGSLNLNNGAVLTSIASSTGAGGSIAVHVIGAAVLDGSGAASDVTGLSTETDATGAAGPAGDVFLSAASLALNEASVRSLTTGTAAGGDVTVRVFGSAVMNGPGAS